MAFGALKGGTGLTAAANSITNPFSVGSISVAVNVGDLIFAVLGEQDSLTVTACGDNLHGGSTYTATNAGTDNGTSTGRAFYKRVTVPGTLTSVSFVATASSDNVAAAVAIFEGPFDSSPLDANPANGQDVVTSYLCPATGVLSQASEVVICWAVATGNTVWAATSPNLLGPQIATQNVLHTVIGYQTVSATTSVQPAFTAVSDPTDDVLGTSSFKQDLNLATAEPRNYLRPRVTRPKLIPSHARPRRDSSIAGYASELVVDTSVPRAPLKLRRTFRKSNKKAKYVSTGATFVEVKNLAPSLYADADTFYTSVVSRGAVDLAPELYTNNSAFYSGTLEVGVVDLQPSLYIDADTFYTTVVLGTGLPVPRAPFRLRRGKFHHRRFLSAEGAVATVDNTQNLTPVLYSNSNTFYTPIVFLEVISNRYAVIAAKPDIRGRSRKRRDTSQGTPLETVGSSLLPSLYADADTFYTTVVNSTYSLVPNTFIDTSAFYTSTVSRGTVNLEVALYLNSSTFYTSTVSQGVVDLAPPLYLNSNTFYSQTLLSGSVDLTPTLYSDPDTFYSITLAHGTVDLSSSLYSDADTFYSLVVTAAYDLTASKYTNNNTFYNQSLNTLYTLTAALYSNSNTFYTSIVSQGGIELQPAVYTNNSTFSTAEINVGSVNLSVSLYGDADTFYSVSANSTFGLISALYADPDAFYSPTLTWANDLLPGLYNNTSTFYNTSIVGGSVTLGVSLYNDPDTFYSGTVSTGSINLEPLLYNNINAFYTQTIELTYELVPSLYSDPDTFYSSTVVGGSVDLSPTLYIDPDNFYSSVLSHGSIELTSSLYTNLNSFYSSVAGHGTVNLAPTQYSETNVFYISSIVGGTVNLGVVLYNNINVFHSAVLGHGTVDLIPSLYVDGDTFYTPLATRIHPIYPDLYSNIGVFYDSTVVSEAVDLRPPEFINHSTFYRPRIPVGKEGGVTWWWEEYKARHAALRNLPRILKGYLVSPIGFLSGEGEVVEPVGSNIEAPKGLIVGRGVIGASLEGKVKLEPATSINSTVVIGTVVTGSIRSNVPLIRGQLSGRIEVSGTISTGFGKIFSRGIIQQRIIGAKTTFCIKPRISIASSIEVGCLARLQIRLNIFGISGRGSCGTVGQGSLEIAKPLISSKGQVGIEGQAKINAGKISTVINSIGNTTVRAIQGRGRIGLSRGLLVSSGEHDVPLHNLVLAKGMIQGFRSVIVSTGVHITSNNNIVVVKGQLRGFSGFLASSGKFYLPQSPIVVFKGKISQPVQLTLKSNGEHDPDNEKDLNAILLLAA